MSPEYVRPYVKAHKNDDLDAEAIAEAATRPTMRFVPVKDESQSDIQALHRARERLVSERTALINHLRALLLERGIVAPQGRRKFDAFMEGLAAEDGRPSLSPRITALILELRADWRLLDEKIAAFDTEFVQMAREDEAARRLTKIPGIGTINATALVAAIGDATAFKRGRDMAAWLGLVPRQMTTGGKPRLLGISKRGNRYLRKNLIHGARAALPHLVERETPLGHWARGLLERAHKNVVVVALANKLARIAWAVLAKGYDYDPKYEAAMTD
jgi:transposase